VLVNLEKFQPNFEIYGFDCDNDQSNIIKLWDLYIGIDMAWREGLSHLIVKSDLNVLVDMVSNNCKISWVIPSLIRRIQELLRRDILNLFTRGVKAADVLDWLAKFSFSLDSWNCLIWRLLRVSFEDSFFMIFWGLYA